MKRLLLLLLLCMSGWVVRGQSECRYWFDQNQASIVSSTSANSSWTIPVDAGGLQAGFHTLYLQVRNGTSPWDAPMSYVFYKPKQSSSADVYQCWFDQNYANAQTGMVGTGFTLDVSALLPGFHTVYIRISHGMEEQLQSFIFYKSPLPNSTDPYQCWFDQNYANAQTGIVGTGFALDASTLLPGFHTAYIRISHEAKEQLQSFIFYKPSLSSSTDVYQCWFDQNYASRQTGAIGTGFNINVSALQPGFHTLYTRIGENTKTQTQSFIFYKQKDSDCSSYTCWIDEDESSAVSGTLGNGDILLDVSGLDGGTHIVNIRLCSGDSMRVETYEFTAPDPPRSLPYCDDFESTEHLHMPEGWSTFNEGECTTHDLGRPRVYQGIGYEDSKELDFFSPCLQVAVLPHFTISDIRSVRISCKAKSSNAAGCYLRVGVMADPTDLSTFVDVDTLRCTSTEVWEDISASLARYHGTGTAIAFYFVSDGAARGCIYIDNLCVTESHIVVDTFASTPDTLVWHDSVYRASTVDTLHFTTAGGDSTVVLHLTVTGWPDNVDSARCAIIPEMSQWGIRIDWSSDNIVSVLNTPLVGDLDGDGHPEIVCFARNGDNPDVDPRCNNRILVFDGVTKQIKATLNLPTWVSGFDAAAYGLVKLPNGTGLIVTADFDFKLRAYDITSATPSTPYWTSDVDFGTGNHEWAANVNFADFNHDGHPEVYIRNKIYNAETGVLLATAPTDHAGASYAHWTHNGAHPYKLSAPIAADVLGDASLELILGNEVYSVDITNTDGTAGNSLTLSCRAQPPAGVPEDGHSQVADFNGDGHLDILITLRTTYTTDGNVYAYVWDVSAGTVSNALNINTNWTGKSIPLIADIDNDGLMEMLIQTGVSGTNEHFQAYKYHPDSQTFTLQWGFSTDENSYSNSITAFDFNQDGLLELMISDQSTMRIVNGSGKSHITAGDTIPMYILGYIPFSQNTIMQYPLIVDVDADGCAEIVSVGSDKLNIFKSSVGTSWGPARKVWNQYMYNATCINEDLTVPQYTFNNAQSLIDPDGIIRRPYNNFLQQQTTLDRYGRPFSAAADIVAHSASLSLDDDTVRLIVNYSNQGDANLQVPYGITLYKNQYRGTAILSDTLTQPSAFSPQSSDFHTISFPRSLLCSLSPSDSILITLNDLGSGIAQHGATHPECDTTNNIIKIATPIYHNSGDTTAVACDNFTWYGLDYPASCSTQHTLSNAAGCDSIVTLNLTIHHPITSDTSASACDNYFWNRTHETYSTTGNYSYHYVNDNGCIDTIKLALVLYGNHSYISEGALPAVFSVSDSKQVFFSHGNLQYQASTNTWRFAENQYDYIGNANANISPTYSGWIDLFAWGCSGWNSGANTYQPWSTNVNPADYLPGGNYENNLDGEYAEADWAWHNAIINGGNRAHVWRTLTITEWEYLLQGRPNALSKRGAATVGAIHGMVVLPDDWTLPNGLSFTPAFNNWTTNVYTLEQWQQMEDAGALFLPAAGFRHPQGNTGNFGVGNYGRYWSSSHYNEASSLYMLLYRSYTRCDWWDSRIVGLSVRPVQQAHPIPDTIISACDNFTFNNHTYTSSGTYYDTLSNIHGCDSITILKLTIRNSSTTTDTQSICDSYTWIDGQTYTASNNTATHTLTNVAGCDSTVTLNLTVNYSNHGDTTATECESFTWWSTNYTNSTNEATHPYTNQWGCDSTVTLLLTINNPVHEAESQTACEIYTWHGTAYTSSGNYIYSYADANGCTQVDTLHLTVNYSTTSTETVTACNSFVWHGTEYTESTSTPTHNTTNAAGCDSITTLHLTVNHCSTTTLIVCDSLSWHGGTYTSSGIYTISTDTLNLTVNHSSIGTDTQISCDTYTWIDGLTYTASNNTATHTLTNAAGCDSTVTLDLTIIASPSLSHSPDTSLLQGSNLTLWASGADILSWTDTSGSIQANDSTFAITPLKSSVYVVTAANEGVNLVYNGDFELGNTGFTTSHTYNSHTNEGAYYIGTNARNQYPSFAIWHDHTSGNGQYMIVNGAGNPNANVWTQTIPVEPNTDYAFSSWICNLSPRAAVSGNLADVAQLQFSINGSQLGDIFYVPEMAGWVKVYEVWNSGNNSSATITILNQNTGWAGNDFGIDDIHFSSLATCAKQDSVKVRIYSVTEIDSSVCDNNLPFVWQGQTITAGGIYRDTVANIYGDDSIVVLNLTVRLSSTSTFEETIVENQLPYTFNGQTFTDSTSLTLVTIPNAVGCDSTINYTLHIQWNTGSRLDSNVCFNQLPVTWNNTLFDTTVANTTIMRTVVIPSVSGSDSTIIMRLHVRPIYNDTIPYSICDNQTHTFEGTVYGGTDAGFHPHMLHTDAYGCDSLRVLNLEVRPTTTGDTVADHCDHFTWYGTEYTASTNTPTHLSSNAVNCDSTTTLHLTIRYSSTSSIEETIVENQLPYTFNGQTFTDSTGLTLVTIPNNVGCDSTISYTLHIQWNTGSRLDSNVCFNQLPVTWNNALFDTTIANTIVMRTVVIPSATGSDSTIIMRLHVRPIYNDTIPYSICDNQTHTFEGTVYGGTDAGFHSHMLHTATYGCDSLRVLNLEVRPTTTGDTVANHCDSFTWYGTEYTTSTDTPTHLSSNAVNCDSATTLHLTIRYSTTGVEADTVIENLLPYSYHDSTFADSISHVAVVFPNTVQCDSVVDFTLFVHRNVDTTLYDTVCNDALPLTWNGIVFDTLVGESTTMTRATVFTAHTGADSTITMHLTVHALYDHHTTVAICDNQQYTFGDSTFVPDATLTHNIDTSQYIEHLDSLLSIHGCDSLSTLHLTSWSTYDHHLSDTVCTNHSYTWGTPQRGIFAPGSVTASLHSRDTTVQLTILDSHFPADTLVTDHLASAHSCDSLSSLHLHLLPSYDLHFSDTICNAEWAMASGQWVPHSYPFEDTTYSATGSYPHLLSTLHSPLSTQPHSCDSTRTLHLKVWPTYDQHLYDTIYDGDHYTFEGTVYDTTGVYLHRLDAVFACDSLRTLHLQRNRRTYNDSNLCQNALPLVWNGVTFADRPHTGGMLAMSDSVHLSGLNGIDSLVVMTVYAHDTSSTVDLVHGCDSLTWQDGHTYHASTTTPFVTLTNRAQCDSVVHLALTVDYTHYYTDRHVVCDSMRWINNSWYYRDTAGVVDTFRTIADCDSVVTLDLTVHYSTSTALHDTICYNDTYYWHGFTIHSTAVYRTEDFPLTDTLRTIHGCDSVVGMIVTKMALPQVDLVHEIDCAAKGYRIIADARAPFSPDSDPQPMPYLLWNAVPIDDALEGQERQTVVKVAPQSLTEYMVFVDYRETPFCPTTARLTLRPVIIDTASVKVNPQILTYDNLSFDAYDLTTEHARSQRPGEIEQWQRTWYVDGVRQWERDRHLAGEADAESDSVIVALEVYNGICYDTALTVIPIRRVALFAPNIFTPLEDDNNRFVIVTTGVIDAELYIYNREGLLVYYTSDLSHGWDGRTNDGKICPQGNYVWRLNYHATDRPHHLRTEVGSVILLK